MTIIEIKENIDFIINSSSRYIRCFNGKIEDNFYDEDCEKKLFKRLNYSNYEEFLEELNKRDTRLIKISSDNYFLKTTEYSNSDDIRRLENFCEFNEWNLIK